MVQCPSAEALERFAAGACGADETGEISTHAEGCDPCRRSIEESRRDERLVGDLRRAVQGWTDRPGLSASFGEPALARYRIRRCIGEGGMGRVFEAEQVSPRRTVALKVLQSGISTARMLRRFEFEAEVLARLDHPGIARIFEAGTYASPSGEQPFFAMELVLGRPLLEFVRETRPSMSERLELVARICDAVHHAHQKGVVHRDLKPANILVTDQGEPKVLDFGVASSIDPELQRSTMHTDAGALVGTLPYMAPEQLAGETGIIDVRADVYALGVILYETASGELPYPVRGRAVAEALRVLDRETPRALGELRRELKGDVETIAAKALARERERRYASASELAADLRRHLRREPIAARPLSALEQMRNFALRHRALVAASGVVLAVLVLGAAATTWQAFRAVRAEGQAKEQRDVAVLEADRSREALEFLRGLLAEGDPRAGGRPHDYTVRELLDDASRRLDEGLIESGEIEADLRVTLGEAYFHLKLLEPARANLERAVELRRGLSGSGRVKFAGALNTLAVTETTAGDHAAAQVHLGEAIEIYRRDLPGTEARLATSLLNLASSLAACRALDEAEPLFQEALERLRSSEGDEHPSVAILLARLGGLRQAQGRLDEAEELYRDSFERLTRARGERHWETSSAAMALGRFLILRERGDEAEPLLRGALSTLRYLYGDSHPSLFEPADMLAELVDDRDPAAAIELFRIALAAQVVESEKDRWRHMETRHNLASALHRSGEHAEAEAILRDVLAEKLALVGHEDVRVAATKKNLAEVLLARGRDLDEAEALLREAIDTWTELLGVGHADVETARRHLEELLGHEQ